MRSGLVLFSPRGHQSHEPLLSPKLLRNRELAGTNLLTLFLYGAFSAVLFLLPFEFGLREIYKKAAQP